MADSFATSAAASSPRKIEKQHLLTDEQVLAFVNHGYHLVEPAPGMYPAGLHERVLADLDAAVAAKKGMGNSVLDSVPALHEIYGHPAVRGALMSLLGPDMRMNPHRHCHIIQPKHMHSQGWHQDGTNVRHHQVWCVLAMYYPQDVPAEMGPTAILPGSHLRNAPTDRMANYTNIRGARFLTVKAGTVAITHYDLWHAGTLNRTDRPRYMLKFLFDRKSPPTLGEPSWNHDPATAAGLARGKFAEMVGPITHYGSDYYKEWELRRCMWEWLLGKSGHLPPGAFKDMLS
jgi:hypothetical protein